MSDLIDNALSKVKSNAAAARKNVETQIPSIEASSLPSVNDIGNQLSNVDLGSVSDIAGLVNEDAAAALAKVNDLKNKADEALKALDSIPTEQELLLLKQRIKADIQFKKSEAEQLIQKAEQLSLEDIKEAISLLGLPSIPYPPKLPTIDPKILQFVLFATKEQIIFKIRQKLSRENLKNAAKNFDYPIAKVKKEGLNIPDTSAITERVNIEVPPLPFKKT